MVALFKRPKSLFALEGQETNIDIRNDARHEALAEARPLADGAARDVIGSIRPVSTRDAEGSGSDRRIFMRKTVQCRVEGKRLDHTIQSLQQPHLSLSLRDLSLGGLSAISDKPMEPGERVAVFFPPQGGHRGWDAAGRVLRCDRGALGYRVALEFDPLPAA